MANRIVFNGVIRLNNLINDTRKGILQRAAATRLSHS